MTKNEDKNTLEFAVHELVDAGKALAKGDLKGFTKEVGHSVDAVVGAVRKLFK